MQIGAKNSKKLILFYNFTPPDIRAILMLDGNLKFIQYMDFHLHDPCDNFQPMQSSHIESPLEGKVRRQMKAGGACFNYAHLLNVNCP